MKFSIERKYFYQKLSVAARAISVFSPLPALSGIHIDVKEDSIVLTGSDSDISIRTSIQPSEMNSLQIESTGSIVMESKYLLEIVRKIESPVITFELLDYELIRIKSQNGEFNLNGISADQYPAIDFKQPNQSIKLTKYQLHQIVSQTSFACGDNNSQRPILNGVNFLIKDNNLYCAGTDSYRLARKVIYMENGDACNVTIPAKSLNELEKSLDEDTDHIYLYIDDKKAQFVFDQTIFQTRLLDGAFPDMERIIPTEYISKMVVNASELSHAIDRTNFIRNDKIHLIKMECNNQLVRIKTSSSEIGNSDEVLTDCIYEGQSLSVTCNGSFLMDAIRACQSEKVVLEFSGEMRPIKITNPDDQSVVMVIVPVKSYD